MAVVSFTESTYNAKGMKGFRMLVYGYDRCTVLCGAGFSSFGIPLEAAWVAARMCVSRCRRRLGIGHSARSARVTTDGGHEKLSREQDLAISVLEATLLQQDARPAQRHSRGKTIALRKQQYPETLTLNPKHCLAEEQFVEDALEQPTASAGRSSAWSTEPSEKRQFFNRVQAYGRSALALFPWLHFFYSLSRSLLLCDAISEVILTASCFGQLRRLSLEPCWGCLVPSRRARKAASKHMGSNWACNCPFSAL